MSKMMLGEPFESAWLAWIEVQKRMVTSWMRGDYATALSEIDAILSQESHPKILSDALSYRGEIKIELGELVPAKEDYLRAHSLSQPGTYSRYTLELRTARICQQLNLSDEAANWYRAAFSTCMDAKGVTGGSALRCFLELRGEGNLRVEEQELFHQVIHHSWKVLKLPDEPDLKDLQKTISMIRKAEATPRSE